MSKKRVRNFILMVLLVVLIGCEDTSGPAPSSLGRTQVREESPEYTIFHIEGMPCVWVEVAATYRRGYAGLSCDWSLWNGE